MDYNILRKVVANCVEGKTDDPHFRLNMFKLNKKVSELGLIPIVYKDEYKSKKVIPEDIPLLSEYFKEDRLLWFDNCKSFLSVIFVRKEDIDDNLQELLQDCLLGKMKKKEKLPCNIKPVRPANKKENCNKKPHCCEECEHNNVDLVATIANIVAKYPCCTAIVAKWVKPESVSLNIRFRVNSILIEKDNETSDETS